MRSLEDATVKRTASGHLSLCRDACSRTATMLAEICLLHGSPSAWIAIRPARGGLQFVGGEFRHITPQRDREQPYRQAYRVRFYSYSLDIVHLNLDGRCLHTSIASSLGDFRASP